MGLLSALAAPSPLTLYRPAHYLRAYHARYNDAAALTQAARRANARNWAQMHNRLDNIGRNDNPDLPTLDPWMVRTRAPSPRGPWPRAVPKAAASDAPVQRLAASGTWSSIKRRAG
jgi:hypothetical protein